MNTTNPQKTINTIKTSTDFAIKLDRLEAALRDIKRLPLTNRQKAMIREVYKGYS